MKNLSLLRHAESITGGISSDDHGRPLSSRGLDAATRAGRALRDRDGLPDLVLCSSALRARQTADRVIAELATAPPTEIADDLYLANSEGLARRIAAVPDACDALLVVAHNPGIAQLAMDLAESGPRDLLTRLRGGFPPAALALLRLAEPTWGEIDLGAELTGFVWD